MSVFAEILNSILSLICMLTLICLMINYYNLCKLNALISDQLIDFSCVQYIGRLLTSKDFFNCNLIRCRFADYQTLHLLSIDLQDILIRIRLEIAPKCMIKGKQVFAIERNLLYICIQFLVCLCCFSNKNSFKESQSSLIGSAIHMNELKVVSVH